MKGAARWTRVLVWLLASADARDDVLGGPTCTRNEEPRRGRIDAAVRWLWTSAMIVQVALTVIRIPPALGISQEAMRDRRIRERFPTRDYLAARIGVDQESSGAAIDAAAAARVERTYRELERRLAQEPGVRSVTFGDRLPGMAPAVRSAEFEPSPGAAPLVIANLWTAAVGPGYFEAFDVPIVAGRGFRDDDRGSTARTVLVNEAFARQYFDGASPVGHRVHVARDVDGWTAGLRRTGAPRVAHRADRRIEGNVRWAGRLTVPSSRAAKTRPPAGRSHSRSSRRQGLPSDHSRSCRRCW